MMIDQVSADPELEYIPVVNEGAAIGLSAGAWMAGRMPVVLMQNSGIGNAINPLTSLANIYKQPMLLLISGRAYGVEDQPQHEIMGRRSHDLLRAAEVPCADLPQEPQEIEATLAHWSDYALSHSRPVALIVPKGSVGQGDALPIPELSHPLSRREAMAITLEGLPSEVAVLASTGLPARDLFDIEDRPANFYMMGSMGHTSAIALGVCLAQPDRPVLLLDGDGSALMHMGSMSTIGHCLPQNLIHVILDNEAYESTGNQDTTSRQMEFAQIARASGYPSACRLEEPDELREEMRQALSQPGPHCIHVKLHRRNAPKAPRITTRWSVEQISTRFREALGPR